MKNIDYKRLKRYDIGKMPTSTGYQASPTINTSSFTSTPGIDMSSSIRTQNLLTIAGGINKAGLLASTIPSIFQGAQQVIPKLGMTEADALAKFGEGGLVEKLGRSAGEGVGKTSTVLSAAGKAAGVAGAAMGAYNIANDIMDYSDRLKGSDMLDMSGRYTQTKNGISYTGYSGFDEQLVRDYTKAQNTSGTLGMTLDAAGTGASIGSLVGPWGTAIGGLIGGAVGFVGGLFGSDRRNNAVEQDIANTKSAISNYNLQAESEAGSQGLRELFYNTHRADKGKQSIDDSNVTEALVSDDETWVNKDPRAGLMNKTGYYGSPSFKVKERRGDNIHVIDPELPNKSIAGHEFNYILGSTPADAARPIAKESEQIKSEVKREWNKNGNTQYFKQLVNRLKDNNNKLDFITDAQAMQDDMINYKKYRLANADCGKNVRKFDEGVNSYASMLLPHFGQMGAVLASRKNYTPAFRSAYVDDNTQSDINQLRNIYYDPTQALNNVHMANRRARYATSQSGALSGGQRTAINTANEIAGVNAKNDIISQYLDKNTNAFADALKTSIAGKQNAAQRMQSALENAYARNDRAQAIDDNFRQQYYANMAAQFGSIGKDYMAMNQYNQARNYQNELIGLYRDKNKLDRDRFDFEKLSAKPDASSYNIPYSLSESFEKHFTPNYNMKFNPSSINLPWYIRRNNLQVWP